MKVQIGHMRSPLLTGSSLRAPVLSSRPAFSSRIVCRAAGGPAPPRGSSNSSGRLPRQSQSRGGGKYARSGGGGSTDAKRLTDAIKVAGDSKNWKEVLRLAEDQQSLYNSFHIGASFVALRRSLSAHSRLSRDAEEALKSPGYSHLIKLLEDNIPTLEIRGTSNVIHSLAYLTGRGGQPPCPTRLLDSLLLSFKAKLIGSIPHPQDISNTAWAIVEMGLRSDAAKEAIDSISYYAIHTQCKVFDEQSIGNTALAICQFDRRDPSMDSSLATALAYKAIAIGPRGFTEQGIANTCLGVATLAEAGGKTAAGLPPSVEALFNQLEKENAGRLDTFNGQDISNLFLALARARYLRESYLEKLCQAIVDRADYSEGRDGGRIRILPRFNEQDVTNILWSCQSLRYLPPEPALRVLLSTLETMKTRGRTFATQGLAQICLFLGVVCFDRRRYPLGPGLINVLCSNIEEAGWNAKSIKAAVTSLYCLSILTVIGGYKIPKPTYAALFAFLLQPENLAAIQASPDLSQQLLLSVSALSIAGFRPGGSAPLEAAWPGLVKSCAEGEAQRAEGAKSGGFEAEVAASLDLLLGALPGGREGAALAVRPRHCPEGLYRAIDLFLERTEPPAEGATRRPNRIAIEIDGPSQRFSNSRDPQPAAAAAEPSADPDQPPRPAAPRNWGDLRGAATGDTLLRNRLIEATGTVVVSVPGLRWREDVKAAADPEGAGASYLYGLLSFLVFRGKDAPSFFTEAEDEAIEAWIEGRNKALGH